MPAEAEKRLAALPAAAERRLAAVPAAAERRLAAVPAAAERRLAAVPATDERRLAAVPAALERRLAAGCDSEDPGNYGQQVTAYDPVAAEKSRWRRSSPPPPLLPPFSSLRNGTGEMNKKKIFFALHIPVFLLRRVTLRGNCKKL